jgi:GNAT acetyltransferase
VSDIDLMNLHAEALFSHDESGRIGFVNVPGGAPAPRFFLGRTAVGHIRRYYRDLSDDVAGKLEDIFLGESTATDLTRGPTLINEYLAVLETHAPVHDVWMGPVYAFPDVVERPGTRAIRVTSERAGVLSAGLEDWVPDILESPPLMAILDEGKAVSVCASVRITSKAHEAGVETLTSKRGMGYAADVVTGWANEVRSLGCTPLYSTSWKNLASQRVARKLGLRQFGVDFHVT